MDGWNEWNEWIGHGLADNNNHSTASNTIINKPSFVTKQKLVSASMTKMIMMMTQLPTTTTTQSTTTNATTTTTSTTTTTTNTQQPDPDTIYLVLTLVLVQEETNQDVSGERLHTMLWETIQSIGWRPAEPPWWDETTTTSILNQPKDDNHHQKARLLQEHVLKFLQRSDQYLAWGSLLLKSKAFYDSLLGTTATTTTTTRYCCAPPLNQHRPMVLLPRTHYRKPYIPIPSSTVMDPEKEDQGRPPEQPFYQHHPLSVSHQFPWVGLVRLKQSSETTPSNNHRNHNNNDNNQQHILVGLDIVVFDHINRNLYDTVSDFVDVFHDHFTPHEWQHIQQTGNDRGGDTVLLQEFYVRWAAKEAYTKALGVGLGCNFGSFQIDFFTDENDNDGDNDNNNQTSPSAPWSSLLWQQRDDEQDELLRIYGRIVPRQHEASVTRTAVNDDDDDDDDDNNNNNMEVWLFLFRKLETKTTTGGEDRLRQGCACTCVGPLMTSKDDPRKVNVVLQVDWLTIDDLIRWHRTNSTTEMRSW